MVNQSEPLIPKNMRVLNLNHTVILVPKAKRARHREAFLVLQKMCQSKAPNPHTEMEIFRFDSAINAINAVQFLKSINEDLPPKAQLPFQWFETTRPSLILNHRVPN